MGKLRPLSIGEQLRRQMFGPTWWQWGLLGSLSVLVLPPLRGAVGEFITDISVGLALQMSFSFTYWLVTLLLDRPRRVALPAIGAHYRRRVTAYNDYTYWCAECWLLVAYLSLAAAAVHWRAHVAFVLPGMIVGVLAAALMRRFYR